MAKIYNIYGTNAHSMTLSLLEAINAISLVPSGANIDLKPNLVVAGSPENGATTHAGVLSGCIEYFRENGVKDIAVTEGSWVAANTMSAMKRAGYDEVCKRYNVPFIDLKHEKTQRVDSPIGPLEICERSMNAGFLVNLPVLKGHCQTVITCALKNLKGCLPDKEKSRFHSLGLIKPIAALGSVLKPGLIVVDSICGDLDFEEGGNPVHTNRMFCGTDPVMIDAYGAGLMGLELSDVPYIKIAEKWGAGSTKFSADEIFDINSPETAGNYPKPSGRVASLTRRVHEDSACSACYAALVRALNTNRKGQSQDIYIGQGWRGKKIPDGALGIGRCCSGADRNVKGCPPDARSIAEMF